MSEPHDRSIRWRTESLLLARSPLNDSHSEGDHSQQERQRAPSGCPHWSVPVNNKKNSEQFGRALRRGYSSISVGGLRPYINQGAISVENGHYKSVIGLN